MTHNILCKIVYILILPCLATTILLTLLKPANNLLTPPMVLCSIISLALFICGGFLWNKIYFYIQKYEPFLYYAILFSWTVFLFLISSGRITDGSNTLTDYVVVFSAANKLADNNALDTTSYIYNYFLHYNNNLKPMILLSWLFRLASSLHISRFYFVLFLVCIQVLLTVWSIGILCTTEKDKTWRFPALVLFGMLLPLYCMTAHFYTDTMSMGLPIISLALLKISHFKQLHASLQYGLNILAALLVALSIFWKITSIIPLIAIAIAHFIYKPKDTNYRCLSFVIALIFITTIFTQTFNKYDISLQSQKTCDPLLSWVALGLKGDGSWSDNREFVTHMHNTMSDTTQKLDYTKAYILENQKYFFDTEHLIQKLRRNFSDGNLMTRQFTTSYDDNTIFWDIYNHWGEYYWRTSQISFCYLETIYMCLFIGSIINMVNLYRSKNFDILLFSTHLSFLGIFIFLMLWEACSRQLYNQMPMLILGSVLLVKNICVFVAPKTSHK